MGWDAVGMRFILLAVVFLSLPCGCETPPIGPIHVRDVGVDVRNEIAIIEPVSRDYLDWSEVLFQIRQADVVLLGEQHDHAVGHAIQLAIVEDVMETYPGSVLALEMLERDEQILVDDYVEGIIDADVFERLTFSANWGSGGGWSAWYLPIIDVTIEKGGMVIAANAPRRYVRLARKDGYEKIDGLAPDRKWLVDYPEELSGGAYRQRFWEFAAHDEGNEDENTAGLGLIDPNDPTLPLYRSQQTWDATMAQSIVSADPSVSKKVVLLVGQFHVEYDGGIVQELRQRNPNLRVFVVSIRRNIPQEDWRGSPIIADVMFVENE